MSADKAVDRQRSRSVRFEESERMDDAMYG